MATIPTIQLFRNSIIKTGRQAAIDALEAQKASVPDGGLILARYSIDGEDNNVKTLLGIVRNSGSANAELTVIDVEGAAENVQKSIEKAINGLNQVDSAVDGQYVSSVSEDKGIITVTRKPLPSLGEKTDSGKAITAITQTNGKVSVKFGGVAAANVSVADEGNKITATNVEGALLEIKTSLDNAIGTGGTVEEQITNKINALNSETVSGNGQVITAISQSNGIVSATAATLGADNVSASNIESSDTTVAVTGTNVSAQISSLATSIKTVSAAAKSYSIKAISGEELTALGANVREAYKLVDEDGAKAGAAIKIYRDSSLKSVALDGQMLNFTYILADGTENIVGVDVSTFLAESEFKDGLEVVNGIVKVKKAEGSEGFLTVGVDGVKLNGVQAAINAAAASATTKVEKTDGGSHVTVTSSKSNSDSSVTYTISESDIASANALLAETTARESADTALSNRLGDGVTSDSTATAQFAELSNKLGTGVTTAEGKTVTAQLQALSGSSTSDTSDTISVIGAKKYTDAKVEALDLTQVGGADKVITTISQTDGKVSATAIDLTASNVKATDSTGVPTAVDVIGETVSEQIASLATSIKSVSTAAAAAHTVVNAKADGHVKVTVSSENSHDVVTIAEDDIASASALGTETTARQNQDDKIEASIGLAADGSHVTTSGNYTNGATTVVGEIAALDTQLKAVSDTLGTGVSTAATVTAQLQALSGSSTSDTSDTISVIGAKKYTDAQIESLDATVKGESYHVDVTVEQSHGIITGVTVTTKELASGEALLAEMDARERADTALSNRLGDGVTSSSTATAQFAELSNKLGTGITTAEGKTVTEQLQALSGSSIDGKNVTSVYGAKAYAKDLVDNLNAEVGSTTGTSKTEAIKIVQDRGKIKSITLGAFDCGTYN